MHIGDLVIDIPASWEDHSLYSYVAPPTTISPQMTVKQVGFRKNVVLQRRTVGADVTLEQCVERVASVTERDMGSLKIDVEDGPQASDTPTRRLSYRVIDTVTNQPVAQVVYVGLIRGTEWQIAFSAPAASVKDALPEFDAMVTSIRAG